MNKKATAFSLIELSIVILIIGILIAGVTQGSRLITASKLSGARTITQSSDVHSIKDLYIWIDVTDEDLVAVGTTASSSFGNVQDGDYITTITSKNNQLTATYQATVSDDDYRPTYSRNAINGLPGISFDGSDDYMDIDLSKLASTDYTIFIVEKTTDVDIVNQCILTTTGYPSYNDKSLHLCHQASGSDRVFNHYRAGQGLVYTTTRNDNVPSVQTYRFTSSKKIVRENGSEVASLTMSLTPLVTASGGNIGGHYVPTIDVRYGGVLGELIIFTRALKDREILEVEDYLTKKWSIKY